MRMWTRLICLSTETSVALLQIWEVTVGLHRGGNLLEQLNDRQRLLKKPFLQRQCVGQLGKMLLALASRVNHGFGSRREP